jgi:tripartite-type tricarboxylate transporter receptor subunit TctC
MRRIQAAIATVAAVWLLAISGLNAAEWPSRPIHIIVPYPAGGTADLLARTIAEPLSVIFNTQFVVDNRAGGGGVIGSQALAQSAPDGYTFGITGIPSHVLAPAMNRNAGYDAMKNFTHIAFLGGPPNVFIVHPSLAISSFKDFLTYVRREAEPMAYASPGVGTVGNLVVETLKQKENIKLQHIPYRGGGPAIKDLIAGHVKVGSMALATARASVSAGRMIPIAITSDERISELPNVPTLKELGYPDLVTTTWFSFSGPAGVPENIVKALNREIIAVLNRPEVRERLERQGIRTQAMSAEDMTKFMQSEIDKWTPVAKAAIGQK